MSKWLDWTSKPPLTPSTRAHLSIEEKGPSGDFQTSKDTCLLPWGHTMPVGAESNLLWGRDCSYMVQVFR